MDLQRLTLLRPTVKEMMHLQEIYYLTMTLGLKSYHVGQYPLHDVTYAPAKFEVATPNGLGGDAYFSKMQNTSH